MATKKATAKKGFEEMLARLDEIVRELEKGEIPLETSLKLYEEGTALIRESTALLQNAEQTAARLQKSMDGSPEEHPFEVAEE